MQQLSETSINCWRRSAHPLVRRMTRGPWAAIVEAHFEARPTALPSPGIWARHCRT